MSENTSPKTPPVSTVPATPEWCQVGSTVAIVHDSAANRSGRSVTFAKVLRIGKRDVVLDNDDRFSVHGLSRRVGGTWGTTIYLRDPKDPAVVALREDIRRQNLIWKAKMVAEDFRYDKNGVTAEDVIRALAPLVANGSEIIEILPPTES